MTYDIQGTFYEACDCEIICSCWAQIEPDMGQCTGLWAWHLGADSKIDGQPVDGCKVVILSNGKSCDDAVNKLIIIDTDGDSAKYDAVLNAVRQKGGAWLEVFNPTVETTNEGVIKATINIEKTGENEADISVSVMPAVNNSSVKITNAVANTQFQISDDGRKSTTQMSGDGRLIEAILGGAYAVSDKINVGKIVSKPDPKSTSTPPAQQGLNLEATIGETSSQAGYTFDLDVIQASAACGKFRYVHFDQKL